MIKPLQDKHRSVSSFSIQIQRVQRVYLMSVFFALVSLITVHAQTPKFKVLAFYNGTYDAAHINFVNEARVWYPQLAAQNGFSWESTNDWSKLNATNLAQYQVVMFLDDMPPTAQRAAFQQYMQNGGAWMGHHVCAFNTNPADWDWYHNQFLGTGAFNSNTWGPTTAVLKCEDQTHPSTQRLPTTFTSAVSEWYSWNNDLRLNPNIKILCSIDPSSFPLGTDPNQSWYSGYYPIMWTNKNYKMIYANFGHNDMDYANNIGKSSTFASEIQNRFILDALLWLGGASSITYSVPGTIQAENYAAMSGVQLEATTDTGGGQNVGYIDANDWMDYKVNVQTAGSYTIQYRIASLNGGGSLQLKSGTTTLATTAINSTGDWQNWTTLSATATLAAGTQTLRLQAAAGGFNLNWIQFTTSVTNTPPAVSISSPANNASFTSPASIVINATATDASPGTVTKVDFYNGTTLLSTDTSSPYSYTWSNVSIGNYSITAKATDDGGATTTSAVVNVSVTNSSSIPVGSIITLKGSNNFFVSGENGTKAMTCTRATAGTWEQFTVVDAGGGKIALRSMSKYVSSENGVSAITCSRATYSDWEKFDWITNASGTISLRGNNSKYVSSENGTASMTCTRAVIGGWESFTWSVVSGARVATASDKLTEDDERDELSVFPNPSAGAITVRVLRPSHVSITDQNGKIVHSVQVDQHLTIEHLNAGLYVILANNKNGRAVKKLIVK